MSKSETKDKIEAMHGLETLELEHYVWIYLSHVGHIIQHIWLREMKNVGPSTEKFAVIHELMCLGGESTPHALAKRVLFKSNSVSAILSRMEKDGLVIKTKDLDKKHMVRVRLTEKAMELYPKALETACGSFKKAMANVPRDEKIQLVETLAKIRDYSFPIAYKKSKLENLTPYKYV